MRFIDKLEEVFKDSKEIKEEEKPLSIQSESLSSADVVKKVDRIFKDNKVKVRLKTFTTFGVEYILAKSYPGVSKILDKNQVQYNNRNDKFIFITL